MRPEMRYSDTRWSGWGEQLPSLFLLAIALGSAAFLTKEFDDPFSGVILVSSVSMENARFSLSE